ncbi:hypothetical protein PIB30_105329 [Stylosanthes scabra]|uniref:Uncharacterized protein n=1 Tax=Stylosanthes scabra TaxID=79078 RepID=A0ABU6TY13_9FABA|nr:hypothetical protein [Stylosanthes scabra]
MRFRVSFLSSHHPRVNKHERLQSSTTLISLSTRLTLAAAVASEVEVVVDMKVVDLAVVKMVVDMAAIAIVKVDTTKMVVVEVMEVAGIRYGNGGSCYSRGGDANGSSWKN